jgi:hypothetical protein
MCHADHLIWGKTEVGRRRARFLCSCCRMEILFRLRFMTWELVEDLKIRPNISLTGALKQMARFDMVHLVLILLETDSL